MCQIAFTSCTCVKTVLLDADLKKKKCLDYSTVCLSYDLFYFLVIYI